ncbi:hypothetical protein C4573_00395 [Candidatus Woesearchaeota archaeon]|nr:MAG: hypothetical protein C4573_00395 [Candidatus Woesearchaeota archaeon]
MLTEIINKLFGEDKEAQKTREQEAYLLERQYRKNHEQARIENIKYWKNRRNIPEDNSWLSSKVKSDAYSVEPKSNDTVIVIGERTTLYAQAVVACVDAIKERLGRPKTRVVHLKLEDIDGFEDSYNAKIPFLENTIYGHTTVIKPTWESNSHVELEVHKLQQDPRVKVTTILSTPKPEFRNYGVTLCEYQPIAGRAVHIPQHAWFDAHQTKVNQIAQQVAADYIKERGE